MRELTTCRSCGRFIATDFSFCPYCGAERVRNYEFRQLLDQSFDEMDGPERRYSMLWLSRLEERLLKMETELDSFLSPSS